MSKAQDAYLKKLWGGLDELRRILAEAPLPERYQPRASEDLTFQDRMGHAGEFALLIETHADRVIAAASSGPDTSRQILNELAGAGQQFGQLAQHFERAAKVARELAGTVEQINQTQQTDKWGQ